VHIFWQKRVRAGDVSTAWWFPSKTESGAIREDRIVLPIPPGVSWKEVRAVVSGGASPSPSPLPSPRGGERGKKEKPLAGPRNGLRFDVPKVGETGAIEKTVREKKPKAPKAKADPKLVAAARELRDRWLEKVAQEPGLIEGGGKYDVTRMLSTDEGGRMKDEGKPPLALPDAA
jgi:hypothetical protein